jgi:hypothetical protein
MINLIIYSASVNYKNLDAGGNRNRVRGQAVRTATHNLPPWDAFVDFSVLDQISAPSCFLFIKCLYLFILTRSNSSGRCLSVFPVPHPEYKHSAPSSRFYANLWEIFPTHTSFQNGPIEKQLVLNKRTQQWLAFFFFSSNFLFSQECSAKIDFKVSKSCFHIKFL